MRKPIHLVCSALILCLALPSSYVFADVQPTDVVVSEIQTGSSMGGVANLNDEFIELYNNSDHAIDITGWKLEYHPATRANSDFSSPSQTAILTGMLYAHRHYLVGRTTFYTGPTNQTFSESLADSGGHVRLISGNALSNNLVQHDLVGWGTAKSPETTAIPAPGSTKTITRKVQTDTTLQDTNNNDNDFEKADATPTVDNIPPVVTDPPVATTPDPTPADPEPTVPPVEEVTPPPQAETPPLEPDTPAPQTPTLLPLMITELLPNPASPATDDADEYIELYNPNSEVVELSGYVLKTGANLTYDQTLAGNIGPKTYLALYSKDSDLVLSNTTGKAVLYDPAGNVVASTDQYDNAPEGQSWTLVNNLWQWSKQPTPSSENVIVYPAITVASTTSATKLKVAKKATTKAIPKVATAKTASTKKVASAKTTKPKTANSNNSASAVIGNTPIHPLALGAVGVLALLYGAYEYRGDIRNQLIKLRRNRSTRP